MAMRPREVTRIKTIVVPYIDMPNGNHLLLLVRDKRSGEYAFVTGGCKKNENSFMCGQRELQEETNGLFQFDLAKTPVKMESFYTAFRPEEHKRQDQKQNIHVRTFYHMILYPVEDSMYKFHSQIIPNNKEVTELRFFALRDLTQHFMKFGRGRMFAGVSDDVSFWEDMMRATFPYVHKHLSSHQPRTMNKLYDFT